MGARNSTANTGVEEVDGSSTQVYRFPPKTGHYFNNHFIMGGERFETTYPEMYLFGENMDLNFLGSRPSPFPYSAPVAGEPSRTLKCLVNIRKETLRFIRVVSQPKNSSDSCGNSPSTSFNIEFTFDSDVQCAISISYFCTEEVTANGLIYTPLDSSLSSETYRYEKGANQQFSQSAHVFDPVQHSEELLGYSYDKEIFPVVIRCVAEEGDEPFQSHVTTAVIEKQADGYILKPLKQKIFVDGLCYLLQEIYGIENKNCDKVLPGDEQEENGAECVICMCDLRDTLILPCRHLCLCNSCADSLRFHANNCPICRSPFRALLQIKALQKVASDGVQPGAEGEEGVPVGYESIPLIEALNGPSISSDSMPASSGQSNLYIHLSEGAVGGSDHLDADESYDLHHYSLPDSDYEVLNKMRPMSEAMGNSHSTKGSKGLKTSTDKYKSSDFQSRKPSEWKSKDTFDGPETASSSSSSSKARQKVDPEEPALPGTSTDLPQGSSNECQDTSTKKKWKNSSLDPSVCRSALTNQFPDPINTSEESEDIAETYSLLRNLKMKIVEAVSPDKSPQRVPATSSDCDPKPEFRLSKSKNSDSCPQVRESFELKESESSSAATPEKGISRSPSDIEPQTSTSELEMTSNVTSGPGLAVESQSIPGTPVSRSSDVSAASASSSKALILSGASNFSTAV